MKVVLSLRNELDTRAARKAEAGDAALDDTGVSEILGIDTTISTISSMQAARSQAALQLAQQT